uniref:Uncharacterized protein AlNc14C345G10840 n=1 Tax=Albugo laibachii Nc14 TaxID=890382 RepID=F0WX85_9STRA|nr:conserved hypothetical protein [Albugo laibachii Nc14]|eukprot:CCA26077.1 conserved hypothetical protein [Albugo laibachii Nc14]
MPIHALFDELQAKNYRFDIMHDAKGQNCSLMFANPEFIALAVEFCDVVLLGCTYKTNKERKRTTTYGVLPRSNRCLRDVETQKPRVLVSDNDLALLNAEKRVFPNATRLLCRWHINKNVVAKCEVHFIDGDEWEEMIADWSALFYAASVEVLEAQWESFEDKYQHHPAKRGLEPSSTSATSQHREQNHLHWVIDHQVVEQRKLHADNRLERQIFAVAQKYSQVVYKVSSLALTLVHEHHAIAKQCTPNFRMRMGLPCKHSVQQSTDADAPLTLNDFDSPWWLDRLTPASAAGELTSNVRIDDLYPKLLQVFDTAPVHQQIAIRAHIAEKILKVPSVSVRDPVATNPKERPSGASSRRKQMRHPSTFEYIERSASLTRKCSLCKQFGHNKRTCSSFAIV